MTVPRGFAERMGGGGECKEMRREGGEIEEAEDGSSGVYRGRRDMERDEDAIGGQKRDELRASAWR